MITATVIHATEQNTVPTFSLGLFIAVTGHADTYTTRQSDDPLADEAASEFSHESGSYKGFALDLGVQADMRISNGLYYHGISLNTAFSEGAYHFEQKGDDIFNSYEALSIIVFYQFGISILNFDKTKTDYYLYPILGAGIDTYITGPFSKKTNNIVIFNKPLVTYPIFGFGLVKFLKYFTWTVVELTIDFRVQHQPQERIQNKYYTSTNIKTALSFNLF